MNPIATTRRKPANDMPGYSKGESDIRPWGSWEVLDSGFDGVEDYCVKKIIVAPGGILSLQSHNHRREQWTVLAGTLTVTLDTEIFDIVAGETVDIPLQAKHRMANKTDTPVVVLEIQRGECHEEDIIRYEDVYGRK